MLCAQTLKGSGGDLIVCEEAAYMDPQVFYEVVVPLLGLRETAMIAISTILTLQLLYQASGHEGRQRTRVIRRAAL